MEMHPRALLERSLIQRRLGAALRSAAAVQGNGGTVEIAAQEEVRAAAQALLDRQLAAGDTTAELQATATSLCNALCMLAGFYDLAERADVAQHAIDEAVEVASRYGDWAQRTLVQLDVASTALARGEFSRTLALLLAVRDDMPDALDPQAQINPHLRLGARLGEAYNWLGDTARAAAELSRTRKLLARVWAASGNDENGVLALLRGNDTLVLRFHTMVVLLDSRRFRPASRVLDTVEPDFAELGPASAAGLRLYRARIAAGLGDITGALAILDAIRPVFDSHPDLVQKRGVIRTRRAHVLLDANRGQEALADAAEGARLASAPGLEERSWDAHWQHARALSAAVPVRDPLPAYDEAIASLDRLRRASLGYRLDNLYLKTRQPMVDEAVLAAAARGDALRCLRYADAVKSRFLAGALAAGPPPPPNPARVVRLDALSAEIDEQRAPGVPDEGPRRRGGGGRAGGGGRLGLGRGARAAPAFDVAAILAGLGARGQAALQLYLAGTRVVAVLLHENQLWLDQLEVSSATFAALNAYAANLRLTTPSKLDYDPARRGIDLASLLPPRLLSRAMTARTLLVSPHGALNILPWAALPHAGRRLFEHLPVAVVPNVAAIPLLAARPRAAPRAGLFGDPLDAALNHAENRADIGPGIADLAALYGPDRLVAPPVTRAAATLDGFRALAAAGTGQGAMLHLACHGTFDYDDPAGSGLKICGRRLTAAEIALRPLGYAEVTMAACSTGVRPNTVAGVQLLGDDIVGLPASLLEAGAGTVLVSTTEAGSGASQAFFNAYHARRLEGADALHAYAGAQRALLSEGRHQLRNWIGFTLYAA